MDDTNGISAWLTNLDEAVPGVADIITGSAQVYDQLFGSGEQTPASAPAPPPAPAAPQPAAAGDYTGILIAVGVVVALLLLRS